MVKKKSKKKITKQTKEFLKEMKDVSLKAEFYEAIPKEPSTLTDIEIRALFKRMGLLTDDERYKFREILIFENLTDAEKDRYHKIYPERTGGGKFDIYFPKLADVDEHYKIYFLNGRTS